MFSYGGKSFSTKAALRDHINRAIGYKTRVVGREFFDEVLADLFADRSYRFKGQRPTAFAYIRNDPEGDRPYSDSLAAHLPGLGWRRFSKETLLRDGDISLDSKFQTYCRERFAKVWRPRLFTPGQCEHEGCCLPATDLDHVSPQHKDIVLRCLPLLTDDIRAAWQQWAEDMGEDNKHFVLPEGHPATIEYDLLTQTTVYQKLCGVHHAEVTGTRSRKRPLPAVKPTVLFVDPATDDLEDLF